MGKKTGIFGGSFNPIHFGHIRLARKILQLADLDEIWFVVSPQNPLKQQTELIGEQERLEMVRTALKNERGLQACDVEFNMPRPSYTWNTLRRLAELHPDREFTLLIGADNWQRFGQWHHGEDILREFPIVIYPRTGYDVNESDLPPGVRLVQVNRIDISSTQVRHRVRTGASLRGYVPVEVAYQIDRNNYFSARRMIPSDNH